MAPTKAYLTTREVAEHFGIPVWLARRIVDGLQEQIPRVGLYRMVPVALLGRIEDALRRRAARQEAAHA